MLKGMTLSLRMAAQASQQHLDADSQRMLADSKELYASAEVRANTLIKREEDLTARERAVSEQA
jgi:hypothetical protein